MRNATRLQQIERQAERALAECEPDYAPEWPSAPPYIPWLIAGLPPIDVFARLPGAARRQILLQRYQGFLVMARRLPDAEKRALRDELTHDHAATLPWLEALGATEQRTFFAQLR